MREPKIPCPHCDRLCVGRSGVYMHITAKHGGEGKEASFHAWRDQADPEHCLDDYALARLYAKRSACNSQMME